MSRRHGLWVTLAGLAMGATAFPAHAIGFDLGLGTLLGRTGLSTGLNYRFGNWNDRLSSYLFLDASRYVNRRRRKRDVEEVRAAARENVRLRVKPADTWVYLNGIRVDASGKDEILLPPGKHRLEFVFPGYRTEVAELGVEPGIHYKVERKLARLVGHESWDIRFEKPGTPVPVAEAARVAAAPAPESGGTPTAEVPAEPSSAPAPSPGPNGP